MRSSKRMKILFVCYANVGRSQVAQAYFTKLSRHASDSAGIAVDELIVQDVFPVENSKTFSTSVQSSTSDESSGWTSLSGSDNNSCRPCLTKPIASSSSLRKRGGRLTCKKARRSCSGTFQTPWGS